MIFDAIQEWFQELLIDGIISNLTGMFDTPEYQGGRDRRGGGHDAPAWNSGIFNMVRSLSETVIVPIAGIVLTFVMCYELIQLIVEKNNLHDFDTWIFFKWIFKTFCAVLIVTNTWNIVMAVFDVAQNVVSQSAGVIISDAGIDISGVTAGPGDPARGLEHRRPAGAVVPEHLRGAVYADPSICIFLVIYGRMIEVYLVTSIGSHPFATMVNREWGNTGQNLSPLPAGPGLPGVPHRCSRGHLRGAGGGHLPERRQHFRRHLGVHGGTRCSLCFTPL